MKFLLLDTYDVTPSAHIFITFLRTVARTTMALFLLLLLMNYLVDPYSIYNTPRIQGFNANKPLLYKHLRLTKAYAVARKKPDAIIMGTSRAEHGLDPEHPALLGRYNSFNLSLNGGSIYESLRYVQHANAVRPLRMVVLAVDFFQFNAYSPPAPDFSEERLFADANGKAKSVSFSVDLLATLASVDSLIASLRTIFGQNDHDNTILSRGQAEQPDPDAVIQMRGGRHEAALFSELNYISHLYFPRPYRKFTFVSDDGAIDTFDYFRRILEYCQRHKIELHLLISPAHARQWELVRSAGLWPQFEQWKRTIVALNHEVAAEREARPFPFWDFSGFNTYTTEAVPPLGDNKTVMQWYWESSHFRKELGDRVLDRVLDHREPGRDIADDFGVLMTADNIERHLADIRQDMEEYENTHPEEVAEIKALVRKYRSKSAKATGN